MKTPIRGWYIDREQVKRGLPAIVIKMLVSSDARVARLLPACPAAWPAGTIEVPMELK